jgi:Rrf2 family iron-sulfur cluster assembly transcriptional regulator
MKLTTKSRYALRAMVDLARQPKNKAVSLEALARRQRIKPKYLEQIFLKLRKARLVASKKGPGGGYLISRDPNTIRLGDIIRAVSESTAPVLCASGKKDRYCAGLKSCPLQHQWIELKKHIDAFLDKHTLGEVSGTERRIV